MPLQRPDDAYGDVYPMKCEFILTNYRHVDGRPVSKCRRVGCDQIAFQVPWNVHATCHAPQWAAGDAAAGFFAKCGVTKETWPKIKHRLLVAIGLRRADTAPTPCNCETRRKSWNRWISFPLPAFVYWFLVWRGWRSPAADRISEGVRRGLIRRV